jgi:hypothetical protein
MTLTNPKSGGMIFMLSQKTKVGIGVLNDAAQPQTCGFFVPNAQLSIMAGWAEQPKGWPVASPVRQLRSVRLPMIGVVWRWVYNLIRDAIMKKHTQAPAKSSQSKYISLFNLIKRTPEGRRVICRNLTFSQASALVAEIPNVVIKFSMFSLEAAQ